MERAGRGDWTTLPRVPESDAHHSARCLAYPGFTSACEAAAYGAGFTRTELRAILSGQPFYAAMGYQARDRVDVPMADGESLPAVTMDKTLA